jgi:signal peptidase I
MSRVFRELALSLILGLFLLVFLDNLFARNYVEGPSMEPNLIGKQWFLVSRIGISGFTREAYAEAHDGTLNAPGWLPPRGAIVTFLHPYETNRIFVKRVIGLPGEEIAIDRGTVYVNRLRLAEPYVVYHDNRSMPPSRVPSDSIIVLGDNRPLSGDSREFGPIPRSSLLGVAVLRYWPPGDFGLLVGDIQ